MGTVVGTAITPGEDAIEGAAIFHLVGPDGVFLPQAYRTDTDELILGSHSEDLVGGVYTVQLTANDLLDVPDTRWLRYFATNRYGAGAPAMEKFLLVPTGAGPFDEHDIQDQVPGGEVMSSALAAHLVAAGSHGGGKRLAYAEVADWVNSATVMTDIPGTTLAFEYDGNPVVYEVDINFLKEEAAPNGEARIVFLGPTTINHYTRIFSGAAGSQHTWKDQLKVPNSFTIAGGAMVVGNTYSFKCQSRTTVATSDFSVLRSFGYNCNVEIVRR